MRTFLRLAALISSESLGCGRNVASESVTERLHSHAARKNSLQARGEKEFFTSTRRESRVMEESLARGRTWSREAKEFLTSTSEGILYHHMAVF